MQTRNNFGQRDNRVWFFLIGGALFLPTFLLFVGYFGFLHPIKTYISPSPYPIAHVPVSEASQIEVVKKMNDFIKSGGTGDSLILNTEEINHLIRTNAFVKNYKVKYLITLEDSLFNVKCNPNVSEIHSRLSWVIKILGFNGYVNAEIEGYLKLDNAKMKIITTRSQMAGRQAPFTLLGKRAHFDLEEFFAGKTGYTAFKNSIASVAVKNKRLIFVRK